MFATRAAILAAGFLFLPACSRKVPQEPGGDAKAALTYIDNGWSQAERDQYYHLAEGSELMPYTLLANLTSIKTGKPFLQNMERFGFLPDHAGPHEPVPTAGRVTVSRSRDAGTAGMEIVGFNCAACHVAS